MLDERKSAILRALVEVNIRTGHPVSSQALLDASGLQVSSATIRNELSVLESEGYCVQPHTSAGRVPTDKGFRFYVDHADPGQLKVQTMKRIRSFFDDFHKELGRLLKETSALLTDITNYPAVVVGPGLDGQVIRGLHLIPMSEQVLMMVVITDSGQVSRELVRLQSGLAKRDIDRIETQLVNMVVGNTIEEALSAEQRRSLDDKGTGLTQAISQVARRLETESRDIFVGGASHLASFWEDLNKVHRVLELLERDASVMALVAGAGTDVRIGAELAVDDATDLAVVSAGYGGDEGRTGRVAVLGPMHMDYRRTIKVVEEVGERLTDNLNA
ncbi:MAG: heat-inducible transcriptional repressor HrcA [Acidimicrobiia bacterium]|nr:heat-inducible transcriptional repressor HrcA [Acidimicrobiia bacterium]NNC42201.1 heat-inducible transcription repressor HrcA [Acidimicrobiia bacterium]NNL26823.1 heat-inducible transcription repressor HrcA [Acidimicrobiia bacterium]NNL49087.1 heat-inducible transcription repressor HrcA [Acidimicrobiia bacterium]